MINMCHKISKDTLPSIFAHTFAPPRTTIPAIKPPTAPQTCKYSASWDSRKIEGIIRRNVPFSDLKMVVYFYLLLLSTLSLLPSQVSTQTISVHVQDEQIYPRTFSPESSIRIQKIEYDGRQTLYVGATNEILQLNVTNFEKLSSFQTGPEPDNPGCGALDERCRQEMVVMTDNYNLLLLLDSYNRHIVACGNVKEGSCYLLSSANVSKVVKKSEPSKFEHIVRSNIDDRCEALAYSDDKGSNIFVSACDSPPKKERNLVTDVDFIVSVRNLEPANDAMTLHYFDASNQRWSFFKPVNLANKNIKIVSTFTVGNFVYIVQTGQFQIEPSKNEQTTRIGRYSRFDSELLLTYSEIPLTCKDSSNSEYPLATAINIVENPAEGLRSHLGSAYRQVPVMMGVFRKVQSSATSAGSSTASSGGSIVCGFSIYEIDEMFKKVIKNCFKGIGKQGPGGGLLHDCQKYEEEGLTDEKILVRPYENALQTKLILLSSYPENVMGRAPADLVSGVEVMAYKDELLTGIAVMSVNNEYTNILLTTSRGHLKKVSFRGQSRAPKEYYEETIFQGQHTEINSDIVFSVEQNFVIFFVESTLIRLPIHNCSAHSSCESCVNAGGPFCGWCTLQDQCTDRASCHTLNWAHASPLTAAATATNKAQPGLNGGAQPAMGSSSSVMSGSSGSGLDGGDSNAWIRYEEKCIAIEEVTPEMVSIHYTEPTVHRPIRLTVTRLPQLEGGLDKDWLPVYYCDFTGGLDQQDIRRRKGGSRAGLTRFILDEGSTERGACGVPTASNFLDHVPRGQAFISVTLSIVTEIEGGQRQLNLTSRLVKFYDCAALSTCIECTSSRFECDWCLSSGQCVNSQLAGDQSIIAQSCQISQRIIGEHSSTSFASSASQTIQKGKDFCPQVGYPTPTHEVKFFHAGAQDTSFELAFKNIPQVRVVGSEESDLMCVVQQSLFTPNSYQTNTPEGEGGEQTRGGRKFVQKMPALLVDGSPDRVQCVAASGLALPGSRSSANATVTLQWGPAALLADNPDQFTIELYNCSKLAGTCGECLSYVDKKYDCGFCQSSPQGFCTISSQCEHTFMSNNPENICLNPKILFFSPQSGPPTGHTLINITGENLGRSADNIVSIYIKNAGDNGIIPCHHLSHLYLPAKTVVCQTSASSVDTEGVIVIEMNTRDGSKYKVESDFKYRYRSSKISDFSPKRGPLDGGTRLIVNGSNLDAGSSVSVYVGGYPCNVKERWAKWLMCVTGPAKMVGERDFIRIQVDKFYSEESLEVYEYTKNPTITKLEPNATIQSGGINVNVSGFNLDVVMFPKIKLMTSTSTGVSFNVTGSCTSVTSNLMTCVTPKFPHMYIYNTLGAERSATSGDLNLNGMQRRNVLDDFLFKARIGFIMDGLVILLPVERSMTVYADPKLDLKTEEFSGILTLESNYPIRDFVRAQSQVLVGEYPCQQLPLEKDTRIRCEVDPEVNGKSAPVVFLVGHNYKQEVGTTAERHSDNTIELGPLSLTPEQVFIVGGALVAGALAVMLILVLCLVCVLKQYRSKDAKNKRLVKRILNAISDNPSNGELVVQHPRMNEQRREPVPVNAFTEYVNRMLFCDNVELSQQVFTQHPHSHHHSNNLLSQYEVGAAAAAAAAAETPMSRRRAAPPHPQGMHGDSVGGGVAMPSLLKDVERWLKDDQFLLTLVDTLEADPHCTPPKKTEFLSLLIVALKSDMAYVTNVMESMVRTMVDDAYKLKFEPKSLFQRNERMAEKMVYNWLVIAMYSSVSEESISGALYDLFHTIKLVIESGAVDQVTGRSQYTINMDNVLQVSLSQDKISVHYDLWGDGEQTGQLLDVPVFDSIAQLKMRIIDDCFYFQPYSARPKHYHYSLVNASDGTVYTDEYQTAQKNYNNHVLKLLTLRSLNLRDGQVFSLRPKPTLDSNVDVTNYPGYHGVPAMAENGLGMPGTGTMFRAPATPLLRIKDAWSTLKFHKGGGGAFYDNLYSNGASAVQQQPDFYHLEEPENARLVGEIREDGFLKKESRRSRKRKYCHNKRRTASSNNHVALNELMKNITTQRVFQTWKATQDSIFALLDAILYNNSLNVVPYPIKYLFDFLESVSLDSPGRDPAHLSLWKINCLVTGFWPNIITRPDYVLDVRRSAAVEQSLGIVGQALIEAAKFDRRQQPPLVPADRNRLTFLHHVERIHATIHDFLARTKDPRGQRFTQPYNSKPFLDALSQLPKDSYNDNQSRLRPYPPPPTNHSSPGVVDQSQLGYAAAASASPWHSQYRVNALRLIYEQFISVYAKPLKERFDHMENCNPDIYKDFVVKTLSDQVYYQDSALSVNSMADSY